MKNSYKRICVLLSVFMTFGAFLSGCGSNLGNKIDKEEEIDEPYDDPMKDVDDGKIEEDDGKKEEVNGTALDVSKDSGVYSSSFVLKVGKKEETNKIYYTLDCSTPTTQSTEYSEGGIVIGRRGTLVTSYPLTKSIVWDKEGYGDYNIQTGEGCTVLNLLEVDESGETVATKTVSYFLNSNGAQAFKLPVVSVSLPEEKAKGFYNDVANESKERANIEYFDFASGERFAYNTQIKIGGNWTKGFPYRTMNVNFNKDENGKKNTPVSFNLFGDRMARNGEVLTNFTRFRLHSGGNSQTLTWFGDAYAQNIATNIAYNGEKLAVATTGYRPCEVYLNGEYWGLYAIREHYSDVYFEQNYGVNKDDVILIDRAHNITEGAEGMDDATTFNTKYHFEVAEDSKDKKGMEYATALFDFLMNNSLADNANYETFKTMVDENSLSDLILTQFYAGNWDFMNNNIKMWRTSKVDPENPYADGKWRFCLHDLDFSFEFVHGDNGLMGANCWTMDVNYLDFYLGNASLYYNGVGQLTQEQTCLISSPMQNEAFRTLFMGRAKIVQGVFNDPSAVTLLDDMKAEVDSAMRKHLAHWGRVGYTYKSWTECLANTKYVVQNRNDLEGHHKDYYLDQVTAAINRFTAK